MRIVRVFFFLFPFVGDSFYCHAAKLIHFFLPPIKGTACLAGRYSNSGTGKNSISTCKPCQNGRFTDEIGLSTDSCKHCGLGKKGSGTAKVAETECLNCALGTFTPTTGAGSCTDCTR